MQRIRRDRTSVDRVDVSGWLTTSNAHRDIVVDLALAGHGVVRLLEWTNRPELASGRLVRVLDDWESTDAIPVNLLYPPSARRLPRVRSFIDFAIEVFSAFASGPGGAARLASSSLSPARRHHGAKMMLAMSKKFALSAASEQGRSGVTQRRRFERGVDVNGPTDAVRSRDGIQP